MTFFFAKRLSWQPSQKADPFALCDPDRLQEMVEFDRTARRLRSEVFDPAVINDSAWSIMQDLFAAHLKGNVLRTKQLHPPEGLPKATVIRYLDHLQEFDIVDRQTDPADSRSTLVSLTKEAAAWMAAYYNRLYEGPEAKVLSS